ncbi:MAG: amidohydrolase family protein [Defluviitaleaceae bacterium]|nr:amidohydrolase family protein [Defluviitaleaceae bacterium]
MIIDFHTHFFPDNLASRAMASLLEECNGFYAPVSDGTAAGQLVAMDRFGVDVAVLQPVITKQSQTKGVNEWAASLVSGRFVPFGGIFPHTDDYRRDIDFVAGLGLKGLKLHAEYQDFLPDDPQMLRIYDYAFGKGLIILQHAGFDPAFGPVWRGSPERFARAAREMKGGVMVVAHLGGQDVWDDVERYLVGSDVYMDTSMGFEYYSEEQFLRIVKNHGADRILFGSDAPWSDAGYEIARLRGLNRLTDEEKEGILGGNAGKILGTASEHKIEIGVRAWQMNLE